MKHREWKLTHTVHIHTLLDAWFAAIYMYMYIYFRPPTTFQLTQCSGSIYSLYIQITESESSLCTRLRPTIYTLWGILAQLHIGSPPLTPRERAGQPHWIHTAQCKRGRGSVAYTCDLKLTCNGLVFAGLQHTTVGPHTVLLGSRGLHLEEDGLVAGIAQH